MLQYLNKENNFKFAILMKINTDITFIINFNVIFNKRFFLNPRFYTYLRHVFMIIFPCPWSILDVKFQKVLILFLKILFLIVLVQNILFFHIQYLFNFIFNNHFFFIKVATFNKQKKQL